MLVVKNNYLPAINAAFELAAFAFNNPKVPLKR